MDPQGVGKLTFFRVYSGKLKAGSGVLNASNGRKERIGRILRMHAIRREDVDEVFTGDIAAAVGLKYTTTGDTLADEAHPILLESITFPEPVISVAIEPKTKADQDKLGIGLQRLTEEDPTFKVHTDDETGQTIIAGMGELHLEIIIDRLMREFKVDANQGKPQVAYKEAIKRPAHGVGRFVRQSGGKGQFGHAELDVRPGEPGSGFVFEDKVTQGRIPREFIPSVEKGIREALQSGCCRRLSRGRHRRRPGRWLVPRGRLERHGVPGGRFDGDQGRDAQGPALPARADHESRRRHAGGISR